MRWKGRRMSDNVIDSRRSSGGGKIIGGGIGVLIVAAIVYLLGGDPTQVLQQAGSVQGTETNYEPSAAENEAAQFVSVVLAETEDFWTEQFAAMGKQYRKPKLDLFHGSITSACGSASAAVGPFYCPADEKIYIDLDFYNELHQRFGAPGDFAMAYVIAHEVGHHVQTILGISEKVRSLKERNEREANRLSVMQELQADFFAGMWAHYAERTAGILDEGDIEEAMNAAEAIGDDKLQKQAQGYVVPDAFTHGTSAQRQYWFNKGYKTGDINQGDTFNADDL